jgi:imidazolonepropionase-like amidohydrolase
MKKLTIINVSIFTGTGSLLVDSALQIEDSRIVALGDDVSQTKGNHVIDAEGKFLMAGFIDAHSHLSFDWVPMHQGPHPDLPFMAARNARLKLASGVTTVRDVGGIDFVDLALKRAIERGDTPGPHMLCAGKAICATGGHVYYWWREADGADEVRKATREQIKEGADFIKLMVTGGVAKAGEHIKGMQLNEDEIRAAVSEAKEAELPVAAHVYSSRSIQIATKCGVDSLEHAPFIDDDAIKLLLDKDVWVVPTQCVYKAIGDNVEGHWTIEKSEAGKYIYEQKTPRLKRALEKGVKIGVGTDCGRHFPHSDFATELILLNYAGLSPEKGLLAATKGNSELLGLSQEIGTVEPGKRADLVILNGNPLENLNNLRNVDTIIKAGEIFHPEALLHFGNV